MSTAETLSSKLALAVAMPSVQVRELDFVELRLLYDPFAPEGVEVHELEHQPGASLSQYLKGLPEDQEWMVFFNGEEIELEDAGAIVPRRGDRVGLILMPQGGGGLKGVLRIVLQAAAIALAFVPGIGWAAALAINIGIGLVNAFLLTPKPPKRSADGDDSRSYGIDGAKNSATEGIPYPVVYGEFRVAGNFADCYTENVGDDQYLYLRTILNDGLVHSVTDIEVNEQPLAVFKNVETVVKLGTLTEEVNPWFGRSIVQKNKSSKLDTGWTSHITSQPVDMVRFDVTFTQGLVSIDEKKGNYRNKSVTFQTRYRPIHPVTQEPTGDGSWTDLENEAPTLDIDGDGDLSFSEILIGAARMKFRAKAKAEAAAAARPAVEYRAQGGTDWATAGEFAPYNIDRGGYVFDESGDGSVAGTTNITPHLSDEFVVTVPPGDYEFRGINGAEVTGVTAYPSSGGSSFTVTDRRTRQIRKSFESIRLDKAHYEVAIRRTSAQSSDQYEIDEVFLADVAEIECDQVALRGTANLSLRIKLNEQLNNIPSVTAKVKGCIVQKYDIDGNPTVKEWSNNPAWIGLDILVGVERGAGIVASRIDWPVWFAFAAYCEANGIAFNGVFDTGTNIGDALNLVLRIGHAAPVPFGTKISVAIDRARDPVMAFTTASIIKDTLQVTYMSMQDRANDFEVTYYDKTDRNKAKTIRYVDPKAVTFNEMPRKASVTLQGVDSLAQAKVELWRMIYANRLIIRTLTFDTFMESINMTQGEVALIQHDMMEWAYNGRLKAGSTAAHINLDQKVEMEEGELYSALVHFSALSRGTTVVNHVVGTKLMVPHSSLSTTGVGKTIARITVEGEDDVDYEVVSIAAGATYDTVQLTEAAPLLTGATIRFWSTDVVEERAVSDLVQNEDGTTSVEVVDPFSEAPGALSNFVFGKVAKVRKPYVLTGVSGNGMEKRKLTFVEYHEGVYGPPEVEIPVPVERISDRQVGHVRTLLFDYQQLVEANRRAINVRVHWDSSGVINYGGADVYMSINGDPWRVAGTALGVSELHLQLTPGDQVSFKVVAYNRRGDRAPIAIAPIVSGTLSVAWATLDPVENLVFETIAFQVDGKVAIRWDEPADMTGVDQFEVQYRRTVDTAWTSVGSVRGGPVEVPGLPTGNYVGRVRAFSPTSTSVWVEDTFTVVVAPGSLMANWTSSNDRNADPIVAPTLPSTGSVEHTLNKDGSANISFEWLWAGADADIDGFIVEIEQTDPA